MRDLETKRLILQAAESGWEIVPRSLGESVGSILFERSSVKGFISFELAIDEDWRHGFLGEALAAALKYCFEETGTIYISIDGKTYRKELIECGMRPQVRGEVGGHYRIYKVEFENGACDKALQRAFS